MNTQEEIKFWNEYRNYMRPGVLRRGQAMMNALAVVAPELYDEITDTSADCYYEDSKIGAFRELLGI